MRMSWCWPISQVHYNKRMKHVRAECSLLTGSIERAKILDPMHFTLVWYAWKLICLIVSLECADSKPHWSHKQAYTPAISKLSVFSFSDHTN
jgi:hypothetical protein